MNLFILTLYFILNPRWWFMNYNYSKQWDIIINQLLDKHKMKNIDQYTAKLGNLEIWISNYPYASCVLSPLSPVSGNFYIYINKRPSRYTIYRLHKRLKIDSMSIEDIREYKINSILN
jgi:hypothetical protein